MLLPRTHGKLFPAIETSEMPTQSSDVCLGNTQLRQRGRTVLKGVSSRPQLTSLRYPCCPVEDVFLVIELLLFLRLHLFPSLQSHTSLKCAFLKPRHLVGPASEFSWDVFPSLMLLEFCYQSSGGWPPPRGTNISFYLQVLGKARLCPLFLLSCHTCVILSNLNLNPRK